MKSINELYFNDNIYYVGSACSALYIYLKHSQIIKSKILCPSNICYSVPFTIEYSNNIPILYDINEYTGNSDYGSILNTLKKNKNVKAIVLPHMFGNVDEFRDDIIVLCKNKEIKVIEDLASGIGLHLNPKIKSDATIFSFGKNKHIDLGIGGILITEEDVDINLIEKNIGKEIIQKKKRIQIFDDIFKTILYSEYYYDLLKLMKNFSFLVHDAFVFQYNWSELQKLELAKHLNEFNIEKRNNIVKYLHDRIDYNKEFIQKFNFSKGSNPWRFNILINNSIKKKLIIQKSMKEELPISIWYPPIDPLFNQEIKEKSKRFSERIINLDISRITDSQLFKFIEILNNE